MTFRPYLELNEVFRLRRTSPETRLAILDEALPNVQRRGSSRPRRSRPAWTWVSGTAR